MQQINSGMTIGQGQASAKKKIQLKLATAHAIKKVRDAPETTVELRKLIRAQLMGEDAEFTIEYQDSDGDKIAIMDDDDLQLAYEWAQDESKGNLKLHITTLEKETATGAVTDPGVGPFQKDKDENMDSSSSDSEDEKQYDVRKARKERKEARRAEKQQRKQSKMMKKIIKHAIKHQTKDLMQSMHHSQPQAQPQNVGSNPTEAGQIDSSAPQRSSLDESFYPTEQHIGVECDGCGMNPIIGVRYKCSVRENFDYCQKCEETKPHEYAFLKIKRANQAPKVIVTAIDDNQPNQGQANDPGAFLRGIMGQMAGQRGRGGPHRQNPGAAPQMPVHDFNDQEAWKAWGDQMKQWGEGMAQQYGAGQGGRGGWCGKRGRGGCGAGGWRRWANQGCGNADGQNQGAWEGFGGHKVNRAKIVKAPTEVIIAGQSETRYFQVELKNHTHWPYKPGCQFVGLFNASMKEILEDVKIPVEQVQAMTSFTLNVPLKIKETAVPCELTENNREYYEVMFSLQGPKGFAFGETVTVKLRVTKDLEQIELYTRVMQLIESHPEGQFAFEEALAAYKETGHDAKRTVELIKKQREEGTKKVIEESKTLGGDDQTDKQMSIHDADSDGDLYA